MITSLTLKTIVGAKQLSHQLWIQGCQSFVFMQPMHLQVVNEKGVCFALTKKPIILSNPATIGNKSFIVSAEKVSDISYSGTPGGQYIQKPGVLYDEDTALQVVTDPKLQQWFCESFDPIHKFVVDHSHEFISITDVLSKLGDGGL